MFITDFIEKYDLFHRHAGDKCGFSLAELMIVMLILSIVLAALMPIVTKLSKVQAKTTESDSLPAGTIVAYYGTTAPTGWLLCNGCSTLGHAELTTLVGLTTPNLTGRVPVGLDASSSIITSGNAKLLGNKSGEENHTLLTNEIPSHYHAGTTSTEGSHTHDISLKSRSGNMAGHLTGAGWCADDWLTGPFTATSTSSGSHYHTFTTSSVGSGTAHNVMQPYIVVNYIIKY